MLDRGGDGHIPVDDRMAHRHVPLPRYQHRQEDRGAEAHVVEGVGELGDQIHPDCTVSVPGPVKLWNKSVKVKVINARILTLKFVFKFKVTLTLIKKKQG